MRCSYDNKEFCLFNTQNNLVINKWRTSSKKDRSLPNSTGNYIFIKNSSSLSKIKSLVISDKTSNGQCLIFNYHASNNSKITLKKLNSLNLKEVLFSHNKATSS